MRSMVPPVKSAARPSLRGRDRAPRFSILPLSSGLRTRVIHTYIHMHVAWPLRFSPVYTTVHRAYDQTRRNADVSTLAICLRKSNWNKNRSSGACRRASSHASALRKRTRRGGAGEPCYPADRADDTRGQTGKAEACPEADVARGVARPDVRGSCCEREGTAGSKLKK